MSTLLQAGVEMTKADLDRLTDADLRWLEAEVSLRLKERLVEASDRRAAALDEMRSALQTYGRHQDLCAVVTKPLADPACTCGLQYAISTGRLSLGDTC